MKDNMNITQLYQDAFKDFTVDAPASTYTKVQQQLKRKSLLTLDPTRLNVFYLALISGAVAWAISGNISNEKVTQASEENFKDENIELVHNQATSAVIQNDVVREYSAKTEAKELPEVVNHSNVSSSINKLSTNENVEKEQLIFKRTVSEINEDELLATSNDLEHLEQKITEPEPVDFKGESASANEVLENSKPNKIERDAKALDSPKAESPKDFLTKTKFDQDKVVPLIIKTVNKK